MGSAFRGFDAAPVTAQITNIVERLHGRELILVWLCPPWAFSFVTFSVVQGQLKDIVIE